MARDDHDPADELRGPAIEGDVLAVEDRTTTVQRSGSSPSAFQQCGFSCSVPAR
ncbi:hypothetical protein [Streptomyces sp. NPDC046870]|uniref:hypothetical protein n=1 Tax=Streptomyces sp. NPDC046870 TaxID=3155135 RepID=UPI003453573D